MFRIRNVLILLLLCIAIPAWAIFPDDQEQALKITADSSSFNYRTGVTIYEGHVKVDQGTTHLTADRLITKNNSQHKMEEAIAYGSTKLAEYWTIPKAGDKKFLAKANVIKFYPIKSLAILEGNAFVKQGENSFQGPSIIYNIKDQIVTAPASKKGRATIMIDPKQFSSSH